jgi:hypothetical protein
MPRFNVNTVSQINAPSAVRTANASFPEFFANGNQGARVDIDITALTGTSVTFTWQYYEATSGTWLTLLAAAAQVGAAHVVLQVDPRIATSANAALNAILPNRMRITSTGTWNPATFGLVVTFAP